MYVCRSVFPSVGCDNDQHIDVAFLLDSSTAHADFVRMRDFVRDLLECGTGGGVCELNVTGAGGAVRVAVYQYGEAFVQRDFALDRYDQRYNVRR